MLQRTVIRAYVTEVTEEAAARKKKEAVRLMLSTGSEASIC